MIKKLERDLPETRNSYPIVPTENLVENLLNYIRKEFDYISKIRKIKRDKLYQPMTI